MPPKHPNPQPTSPPTKRLKTHQTSISTFFKSPSKPAQKVTLSPKAQGKQRAEPPAIIEILDSDDDDIVEVVKPVETDEQMARRLAGEWGQEVNGYAEGSRSGAARGRALNESKQDGLRIATMAKREPGYSAPPNGKSLPFSPSKPLHPMFAARRDPEPATTDPSDIKKEEVKPKTERDETPLQSVSPLSHIRPSRPSRPEPCDPIDFDMDSLAFRPETVDVSKWPNGRLPYSVLVGVYVQVARTRSRLVIVRVLTNFLHLLMLVSPPDLSPSLYLLSNHLRPAYTQCELGVGFQILSKSIREVSGLQARDLKRLWDKYGDPGDVAFDAKANQRTLVQPAPLAAADVYKRLLSLASIKGLQSGKLKGDVVRKLIVQARGDEVRYLVRSMIGNLRIGAVRLTLLAALSRAAALRAIPMDDLRGILPLPDKGKRPSDPVRESVEARLEKATRLVRKVYVRHPNYDHLVRGLEDGLDGLEDRVPVSVGVPLSPMLGSITRSIEDVYARLGSLPFTAEAKLDGQRLQMHVRSGGPEGEDDGGGRWVEGSDGKRVWVRLFSRHLEDMTEKYPDICALGYELVSSTLASLETRPDFPAWASPPSQEVKDLLQSNQVTSFVLDAEIVAVDKDTGAHRTFQELTNRAKKDVKVEDIKVVVEVCAFDLMLLNDAPLLGAPLSHRRHLLRSLLAPRPDTDPMVARFSHIANMDSFEIASPADLRAWFDKVVDRKAEGLMVKLLEAGIGREGDEAVKSEAAAEDDDMAELDELEELEEEEGQNEIIEIDNEQPGNEGADGDDKKQSISTNTDEKQSTTIAGARKKALPATYEPDMRSMGWLKVKKDYLEGLGDSLDLVPIGAWWGMGRKAGWWSPILLAARNPESGALEAVCKCISGFTDSFYKDLIARYPPDGAPDVCSKGAPLGYVETGGLIPDVWFVPREVWEIKGADITLSPVYPAAAAYMGGERGLSLRFPRFIRVRDDKSVEEATTAEEFAGMYRRQMRPAVGGGGGGVFRGVGGVGEVGGVGAGDKVDVDAVAVAEGDEDI